MRLRWPLLIGTILLLGACEPQSLPFENWVILPDENDLHEFRTPAFEHDTLQGAVMTVQTEEFTIRDDEWTLKTKSVAAYDTAGHCLAIYCRHHSDHCTARIYTYDSLGRRIQTADYYSYYPIFDSLKLQWECNFSYSRNGRRVRAELKGGEYGYQTEDSEGTSTKVKLKNSTYRLRYNRKGQLCSYAFSDGSKYSYRHNAAGQLSKSILPTAEETRYEYDGQGRLLSIQMGQSTIHRPDSTHNGTPLRQYDSQGRCVEKIDYYGDSLAHYSQYLYDDHNNWTRLTELCPAGPVNISFVTNRTITYYQ